MDVAGANPAYGFGLGFYFLLLRAAVMTSLEKKEYDALERARETLHATNDRLVKFDALQTIISRCRSLRLDPLPWLKEPKPTPIQGEKTDTWLRCPHCDFKTDKGIQSLRAHVGMKHKNLSKNEKR